MKPTFSIVLHQPEIPWNTGAAGRTALALGAELILIEPLGFSLDNKEVRRSGLDYWEHVSLSVYANWETFLQERRPRPEELVFFSTRAGRLYYEADYGEGCYLIFGSETRGLPAHLHEEYAERFVTLPQCSTHIRSLNLANTVTAAGYEALRQLRYTK